ncbi:unnamed protein product [Closterium sp. Yama58-4]|nr:unnamed protein product [Closterium sp. Yama58-4]
MPKRRVEGEITVSGSLNVERRGVPKLTAYWSDLFHTLINIPNIRFYPLLLLVYSLLFGGFALPYYYQSLQYKCIPGVKNYWHALWFSVQSAMTIGYGGELVPDPDCFTLNLLIALQSLAALIVAYSLLGIVYTRFALPSRRASSLVFSHCMVLNEEDGVPRLSFRVANVRKHQLIEAHAQLLVAINNIMSEENEALFKFSNLPILGGGFVFLALPCIITHAITKHSPLHGMSLAMMERADIEFLVLIEGVDAPTSAKLQARHSYSPRDIKFNHRFCTMVRRSPSGIRRVDFTKFHDVQPVPATLRRPHFLPHAPSWENLRNIPSLSTLPSVLRHPTAVSTDKSGAIMGRKDAAHPFPAPDDSASASQASLAYPPSVSAAAAAGDSTAPVAADTIRKNSSFMNILSLGFGTGSGWGGGVWGSGVWGGGVLWSGGPGTGAEEGSRGTVAAGRGGSLASGNTAGDVVRGSSVNASTSNVAAEDWRRVLECRAASDSAAVGGGSGGGLGGGRGHEGGAMFLPLAGMEHELSMASLPPVIEGSSGSSSPASVPPAVISNSGVFNRSGAWNTAHVGTWSMETTAEAAASGAVVIASVAVATASTAVIAGGGDAAATVGTPAGSVAQAPAFEGRKQMRRMVKRGSAERWDRIGGGMTTEQGRLSRRVSFEVSPVAEMVGEGGAQQGAELTAGRECASVLTAAVLYGGSRRDECCKKLTQGADRHEIEEMVVETPNKKGRKEQRDLGGRRHGRAFSEPTIPVPSSKRNSASSRSSMSGGIGVGGRRSSGAGKQGRSSGASGLPGCWTDQSPLLLMNSFSVRSASHMLEMDARHRIAVAEKREQQWRALVVDLAIKVQSSKALHAPDVDCHPLLNRAKEFLEKAAEEDDVIGSSD